MKRMMKRRNFLRQAGVGALALPPTTSATSTTSVGAQVMGGGGRRADRGAKQGFGLSRDFLAKLPQLMEWANVPGVSVAILADGKVSWTGGFGVKKAVTTDAVTADTVFGAASLSKPVFAYAVFKLRDEKLIDLDRPLADYLAPDDLPDDPRSRQITARHVLSHTTGWQNWRGSREQKLSFAFTPGARWGYSGEGYYWLQRVVEKITACGFEEFMRERLLKPLGMTRSCYGWMPELETQIAWGHNGRAQAQELWNARQGRKLLDLAAKANKPLASWTHDDLVRALTVAEPSFPTLPNNLVPNAAGSLLTSANDYALFLARLMDGAARHEVSISEASRKEMLTPQVKLNSALSWGLGWGLESANGRQAFWHWGDNGTYKTFVFGNAVRRTAVVVFTNGSNGHKLWQRVVAAATGSDHAAFLWWMA